MARPRTISDETILGSARSCFLRHGPGVSTTVIADQLGISQASLFKRFGTKEQLLRTAMRPEPPDWEALLGDGPDDRDLREQLVEIAGELDSFYQRLVPAIAVLRASGRSAAQLREDCDPAAPLRGLRALAGWLRAARAQGRVRSIDADATAMVLIGSLQSRAFLDHMTGSASERFPLDDEAAYIQRLVDVLWRGIAPEEAA